jgi:hypothetical protein
MGVVEVWREPSEFWRWRYIESVQGGGPPLELLSNEVYESREEALKAAMTAYPGVPVLELDRPPDSPPPEPHGRRGMARMATPLAAAGVTLAVVALRARRRRRRRHSG